MRNYTESWKAFRTVCIIQLILVALKGILPIGQFMEGRNGLLCIVDMIAYALIFLFVYNGLSLLNYNYPDVPLTAKQKRSFNILFLINFILIAYLFAQVINTWWMTRYIFHAEEASGRAYYMITAIWSITWVVFIIHLIFLGGMYNLRRLIHDNTINTWYDEFDQRPDQN